jgi:hypothetical protein
MAPLLLKNRVLFDCLKFDMFTERSAIRRLERSGVTGSIPRTIPAELNCEPLTGVNRPPPRPKFAALTPITPPFTRALRYVL